ncbi:MAG: HAMP domain-containing histidine kinase [Eubacterium sp.]|nr:HAMP domain-containing histidine kinase [Eubacterium sp.]
MKFSVKIMLSMLCLLSLLFGIGGSLMISLSFNDSLERERSSAYNSYQMVLNTLQIVNGIDRQVDYDDIGNILNQLSNQKTESWTALRLYNSEKSVYEVGVFDFSDVSEKDLAKQNIVQQLVTNDDKRYLIVSGALQVGGETMFLDMAYNITPLFETRSAQEKVYQSVFLFLIVICALLSYSISRILTRPLSELSKTSQAISNGNFSKRCDVKSNDEVGRLAVDFNTMVDELENNIKQQESFISSFAHEMKTPMTSVIGYADLIRSQMLSEKEVYESANFIVSEGRRLEGLSQKLLELFVLKEKAAVLSSASPSLLIEELVSHLAPVYEKQGIILKCTCEAGCCLLESDLFKSLLINLWDNARKAMENGGTISVKSVMTDDGCRITVSDNGTGIPDESLSHLTEAFYRVDKSRSRAQGGAGIGLALCKEIASLHNGSIGFESELGVGTTVTVEFKGGIL